MIASESWLPLSSSEIIESKIFYMNLGCKHWVTQGWMSPLRDETAFLLNASPQEAHLEVVVYYSDRDPVGPYHFTVPARRMKPLRFTKLSDPEPIPHATDYATTIESDVPIVVQSLISSPQCHDVLAGDRRYPTPSWLARSARNDGEPPIF